jgi:hypothetical protein
VRSAFIAWFSGFDNSLDRAGGAGPVLDLAHFRAGWAA